MVGHSDSSIMELVLGQDHNLAFCQRGSVDFKPKIFPLSPFPFHPRRFL